MKYVILLFMLLSASVYAQYAQPDSLDKIELKNNQVHSGKVIKVTSSTVEFREAFTNLLYEYQKSEIKDLKLSNGTILSFSEPAEQGNVTGTMEKNTQNTNPPAKGTESNVTNKGNTTTDNTGAQKTDTSRQGQQTNRQTENEPQQGLSTTALVLLGAAGVIVLLLIGKAIF